MESKQTICSLLLKTLQATRKYADLESLVYTGTSLNGEEVVIAQYRNGCRVRVNVTYDSGGALIEDVMRRLA